MTIDFDSTPFGVTISHAEHVGPRLYRAEGTIFHRDTGGNVHRVVGTGSVRTAAEDAAIREARAWAVRHV